MRLQQKQFYYLVLKLVHLPVIWWSAANMFGFQQSMEINST